MMQQFQLLEPGELQTARNYLEKLSFRDGAATAHGHARSVKSKEEMESADPVARELSAWFATRIMQHPNTQGLVFPKTLTRPIVSRTSGGGHYGLHTDLTQLQDIQGRQMRTDLSFTLFLSDPATYEGGALSIQTETGRFVDFRLLPGEIVFYPSGRLHEVKPVTRGERLVCIGWIESMIYDEEVRNALWSLMDMQTVLGKSVDKSSDVFQSYQVAVNALRRCLIGRV